VVGLIFCLQRMPTRQSQSAFLMLHAFGHAYSPWSDMAASLRAERALTFASAQSARRSRNGPLQKTAPDQRQHVNLPLATREPSTEDMPAEPTDARFQGVKQT
jgi:hypothetical protein